MQSNRSKIVFKDYSPNQNLLLPPSLEESRERLTSEKGIKYRSRRPADVEAVFVIIKANKNYMKFLTKGLSKVEVEAGILALSHNLGKAAKN